MLCQAGDLIGRTRQGKGFMTLDEGDAPLRPALFRPGQGQVMCVSEAGRVLVYPVDEVKVLRNGGRGVILMGLDPKESLLQAIVFCDGGVVVEGVGRGAQGDPARDVGARARRIRRGACPQRQAAGAAGQGGPVEPAAGGGRRARRRVAAAVAQATRRRPRLRAGAPGYAPAPQATRRRPRLRAGAPGLAQPCLRLVQAVRFDQDLLDLRG